LHSPPLTMPEDFELRPNDRQSGSNVSHITLGKSSRPPGSYQPNGRYQIIVG